MRASLHDVFLDAGRHTIQLPFHGQNIGRLELDGPFHLVELWATYADQQIAFASPEPDQVLAHRYLDHLTAPYAASDFETVPALLSGDFRHQGLDSDADGFAEALLIDVPLLINYPGTYQLDADLYDAHARFLGHASWLGDQPVASLRFDVAEASLPFVLEHLELSQPAGPILDSRHVRAYEIADPDLIIDQGALAVSSLSAPAGSSLFGVSPSGVFTSTTVDSDANGLFDQLIISAQVDVTDAGDFRIEGLLVDEFGSPVAWSVSDPQSLVVGTQQLHLVFDGSLLYDHMLLPPASQSFTLIAVKIFKGNLGPAAQLEAEVSVATTTPAFSRDQFEPLGDSFAAFEDDMEQGAALWSASPDRWSLDDSVFHSPSHAWHGLARWGQSGSLTSIPIDLSQLVDPQLRFRTAFDMSSPDDVGFLQLSSDGIQWSPVSTYTNATSFWSTQLLDLSSFDGVSDLQLRFLADSQDQVLWYLDDVLVLGWPAVTSASFSHSPQPVLTDQDITFVAAYDSIDSSQPLTFTWDFDDGSPLLVSHSPTVTHQFPAWDDYAVSLSVFNPFDSAVFSHTITAFQPIADTAFAISTPDPSNDWQVSLTSVFTPTSATLPVTFTWSFGDASDILVTSAPVVTHAYALTGTYTVWLTTTNDYGDPVSFSHDISVPLDDDADGIPNSVDGLQDTDNDGTPNYLDTDSDGDSIPDAGEWSTGPDDPLVGCVADTAVCTDNDADSDGMPNYVDTNADNDGAPDILEGTVDIDGNGIPSYLEYNAIILVPFLFR